jgi:flagellar FliL protein
MVSGECAVAEDDKEKEEKKEGEEVSPEAAEAAEQEAKKAKKKKLIIVAAAAVVLLLVVGGGAAFFMTRGSHDVEAEKQQAEAATDKKSAPVYFSLGDQLVNLSGEGKHPNFLKVKISLELADEKDLPLMDALKPRIVDNFQVYLRELRIDDLRGSAGMYRLREELLMRVTEAAAPVRIRDVLFQEMLVQ